MANEKGFTQVQLLPDKYKADLNELDLFDRVINMRINFGENTGSPFFVIRSDYTLEDASTSLLDVAADKLGLYSAVPKYKITKCVYKPDIRVKYNHVAKKTNIEIDIYLSNFYMFTNTGEIVTSFSYKGGEALKPSSIILQLGYFGQFRDYINFNSTDPQEPYNDYVNFNKTSHGITTLSITNITYSEVVDIAPKQQLHIHGYIGNDWNKPSLQVFTDKYYSTQAIEDEIDSSVTTATERAQLIKDKQKERFDNLDEIFSKAITSRFINDAALTKYMKSENGKIKQINTNKKKSNKIAKSIDKSSKPDEMDKYLTANDVLKDKKYYDSTKCTLNAAGIEAFGVHVFFSMEAELTYLSLVSPKTAGAILDKDGNPISAANTGMSSRSGWKLKDALVKTIRDAFGNEDIMYTTLTDGNVLIYSSTELTNLRQLRKSFSELSSKGEKFDYDSSIASAAWDGKLPAVYSINISAALSTIKCPFFFNIDVFDYVKFTPRYANTDFVQYFAGNANAIDGNELTFYVINQLVDFSTYGENEMTLTCVLDRSDGTSLKVALAEDESVLEYQKKQLESYGYKLDDEGNVTSED